jgi:hypothetical protein
MKGLLFIALLGIFVIPSTVFASYTAVDTTSCGFSAIGNYPSVPDRAIWFESDESIIVDTVTLAGMNTGASTTAGYRYIEATIYKAGTSTDPLSSGTRIDSTTEYEYFGTTTANEITLDNWSDAYLYKDQEYILLLNVAGSTSTDYVNWSGAQGACDDESAIMGYYAGGDQPEYENPYFEFGGTIYTWYVSIDGDAYGTQEFNIESSIQTFQEDDDIFDIPECDVINSQYTSCVSSELMDGLFIYSTTSSLLVDDWKHTQKLVDINGNILEPSQYYNTAFIYEEAGTNVRLDTYWFPEDFRLASSTIGISQCVQSSTGEETTDFVCSIQWFGNGHSTSTLEDLLVYSGWSDPDAPAVDNVDTGNPILDKLLYDIKYQFPFGYAVRLYEDIYDVWISGTSSATEYAVPYAPHAFGLGTGNSTTTISLSSIGRYAKTEYDWLFDPIDKILWGIFGLFLFFRIVSGTWHHGLEYGGASYKAGVMRDRYKYGTKRIPDRLVGRKIDA